MKKERIWLSLATMGGREQEYMQDAFATNWVVPVGPNVEGFERDLESCLGEDVRVVALSSGTAALHLAMVELGIGQQDEVICQSFTFTASANPIVYQGATPVFVDSEPDTWNISPELLEKAIIDRKKQTGEYPKAIVMVHLFGMPAKMDEIFAIASHYGIPVIEDSAEALGSEYKGRKCGTFGCFGVLSFNGNKIITTSGGGALVCRNEEDAKQTIFLATQARESRPYYHHEKIGYNYRLSNICAGIGRGQMHVFPQFLARRREIHSLYTELLSGIGGIEVKQNPGGEFDSNFWLTCLTLNNPKEGVSADTLRCHMESENIETRLLWKPLHLQPIFAGCPAYLDGTSENCFAHGISLPSSPALTNADVERVAEEIIRFVK